LIKLYLLNQEKKYSTKKAATPPKSPRSMSPKNNVLTSEQISPENYTSNIPSLSPTRVSQSDQDKKGKRKTKRQKLDEQTVNSKFSETKKKIIV